jgi:ABC-type dipeptide/oligopeptide/nickel transport system permease subunit
LLFEENSDLEPQLVLLGQVYGVTGTDYWRRDLTVPLFWGMPFTLLVGFLGTFITTLIAMLLPAIGVWFGGGLDNFIQRLTEVNMVYQDWRLLCFNAIFGIHIWIILELSLCQRAGSTDQIFPLGVPAKEALYIEMARPMARAISDHHLPLIPLLPVSL